MRETNLKRDRSFIEAPAAAELRPAFLDTRRLDISIDTSGFCNARCESCPWPFMTRSESVLSLESFKTVMDRFKGYEFGEFAFNSINEPFSDKTILEKLDFFIDSGIKTDVLFFSSNWLIPKQQMLDEFIALIVKATKAPHIRKVSLNATISGIDEQTYDELQAGKKLEGASSKYKPLDFSRASENVLALIRGLQAVVDPQALLIINIKAYGFAFTSEQYQTHWRDELMRAGVDETFINTRVKILLNHAFTSFARKEIPHKATTTAGIKVFWNYAFNSLIRKGEAHRDAKRKCSMNWLSTRLVIGPDAAVGLCCHEGARKVNLGSLVDTSLNEVVSSPLYANQLKIVNGISEAPDGHLCQKCEFYVKSEESQ